MAAMTSCENTLLNQVYFIRPQALTTGSPHKLCEGFLFLPGENYIEKCLL